MDSLRLRFPKLASIRAEDGSLSLSFLNLAAQLKFSVSIPMSKRPCTFRAAPHSHGCVIALYSFILLMMLFFYPSSDHEGWKTSQGSDKALLQCCNVR